MRGNKNAAGSYGSGPQPAIKDTEWHKRRWELETTVVGLEDKIKSGVYSVRDVYLLKALKGNDAILKNLANKVLATLHDLRGPDGQDLFAIPDEDRKLIQSALRYAGTRKLKQKNPKQQRIQN